MQRSLSFVKYICLLCKSVDLFLYDRDLRHDCVNATDQNITCKVLYESLTLLLFLLAFHFLCLSKRLLQQNATWSLF